MFVIKSLKALELCTNPEILVKDLSNNCIFHLFTATWTMQILLGPTLTNQKHAIRIIYDKDRFAHTTPLFKHAKALTVYEINLFQILSLIFQCKNWTAPLVFQNLYTLKPPSKYSVRTGNVLPVRLKRTKFGQFFIYFRGPYLWNNILAQRTHL